MFQALMNFVHGSTSNIVPMKKGSSEEKDTRNEMDIAKNDCDKPSPLDDLLGSVDEAVPLFFFH